MRRTRGKNDQDHGWGPPAGPTCFSPGWGKLTLVVP
jgi:hypothetical protein